MAARKLQQEIDKCFKKVEEGVMEFDSIYEKIEQSSNAAQKDKLEDNLKREIKKLQRLRDQIKTWAQSNDIKDKGPLLDKRKLIETKMENFKAVEKAMKTKAFSKEGLSAAAKLDPKERAKADACEFLGSAVDDLERQIETLEAEAESLQATMKKGKSQSIKADRIDEIQKITERHKWHQGKLELIKRSLENGGVETEQVNELEDSITYYVKNNTDPDFMEDDTMYDDLDLKEDEDNYGMNNDNDRVSSQDTQSIQDDTPEVEVRSNSIPKPKAAPEPPVAAARRPSTQMKSPLPSSATLHTPLTTIPNGAASQMKPAAVPTRAPGETLKYASAAAAAAASDKMGIAPLPPPPEATLPPNTSSGHPPLPSHRGSSVTASPTAAYSQPASSHQTPVTKSSVPVSSQVSDTPSSAQTKSPALSASSIAQSTTRQNSEQPNVPKSGPSKAVSGKAAAMQAMHERAKAAAGPPQSNGLTNGIKGSNVGSDHDESIFHLPVGLADLLQSYEGSSRRANAPQSQSSQRMLTASLNSYPEVSDALPPRNYKPKNPVRTPAYYPQEINPCLEDARLYSRIDPDTLFYVFYYKQETYQQYLAAKALKDQSWRFHKQYQTWFQRHEEPKTITEEFEQGTYRFFDYESTWMNRRKADFKFAYKFLEDDV